jgi:DNA repair protein RecO (recombination protein O)
MEDWRDEGIVLSARRHGETSAILEVFTAAHGRHAGVVRGGAGRRLAAVLQSGNELVLRWQARLGEHMGSFAVEPLRMRTAELMADRRTLAGLAAVAALLAHVLPERAPHPALYGETRALLDAMARDAADTGAWGAAYLRWELALLDEAGFGLDLSRCAATGSREDLAFVSPRTGAAVSRAGAGAWAPRLLPLPPCLIAGPGTPNELAAGLRTTGHFLTRRLAPALGNRPLPAARDRLARLLAGG